MGLVEVLSVGKHAFRNSVFSESGNSNLLKHTYPTKKKTCSRTVSHAIGLMWACMAFGIQKDLKFLE